MLEPHGRQVGQAARGAPGALGDGALHFPVDHDVAVAGVGLGHRGPSGKIGGSRPLLGFCDQLADQLYRYRQLSVHTIYPCRDINAEHEAILKAVLDGNADDAVAALQSHYTLTADIVLADLVGSGST